MTADNITRALQLAFKLVHTASSASFLKQLTNPWPVAIESDNIFAINNKAANQVASKINSVRSSVASGEIISYLNVLQGEWNIRLPAKNKNGLMTTLLPNELELIKALIVKSNKDLRVTGKLQSAQFDAHELLHAMGEYLVLKNSIESGTGHPALDKLINRLIETKPVEFFKKGYIADLFVWDRMQLQNNEIPIVYIRCHRSYLSTMTIDDCRYVEQDPAEYELFKVA